MLNPVGTLEMRQSESSGNGSSCGRSASVEQQLSSPKLASPSQPIPRDIAPNPQNKMAVKNLVKQFETLQSRLQMLVTASKEKVPQQKLTRPIQSAALQKGGFSFTRTPTNRCPTKTILVPNTARVNKKERVSEVNRAVLKLKALQKQLQSAVSAQEQAIFALSTAVAKQNV